MALMFFKMILALLFAMSLFQKMFFRSVSTFLTFFLGFAWVFLDSLDKGDIGLWIVSTGLIFMYWRAMQKPPADTLI
ncbi:hypothetical protein MNB_SV-14-1027 [hydrothermal vent metagenome]|uniref:Uncharacterized protein n=1 Tax=hydrothermal vent metagenome TaxID=652676 RepID=A0A1W1CCW4_9ZZZZ